MKFVDTHIHLSDDGYAACFEEIIAEAETSKVAALVSNSTDLKTSLGSLELAEKHPGLVYAAVGIHPQSLQTLTCQEVEKTLELIKKQKLNQAIVAIGEIGLDLKYMPLWEKQLTIFDLMLHTAEDLDLPVIVHSRGTTSQIVDMLPSYRVRNVLLHWFSGPINALTRVVDNGYYISEGAPTLYSKVIREIVREVPLANLLTETDGPVRFFKPPFHGKRTTPAFIPQIVNAIAKIKGTGSEDVANQIMANFQQLLGLHLNS